MRSLWTSLRAGSLPRGKRHAQLSGSRWRTDGGWHRSDLAADVQGRLPERSRSRLHGLPVVASMEGGGYDLELLVELDPDLVVAWATDADDAGVAAIEETLGVPVYSVFLTSRDDLAELTVNMGILLDAEERANEGQRHCYGASEPD
jgi:hypothetical protein